MTLLEFIDSTEATIPALADELGVSAEAVRMWVKGQRMPGAEVAEKIKQATNGAVTPNDLHAARLAWLNRSLPDEPGGVEGNAHV